MSFWASLFRTVARNRLSACSPLLLFFACGLTGCVPGGQSQLDEEREPHFLEGKSRLNARDYKGAAESFEKGLQVNPHSAAAHFELALLCQQNKQDYAAAIYHFDRFLELRPRSDYADIVKQRVLACKQELARTVSLGPVTQTMQREFEQLAEQNKRLQEELEACRANLVAFQQFRSNQANQPAAPPVVASRLAPTNNARPSALQASNSTLASRQSSATGPLRKHTVKPGDTPTTIARNYGVKLDALMAANPNLDARRLQIGQVLNVPAQSP